MSTPYGNFSPDLVPIPHDVLLDGVRKGGDRESGPYYTIPYYVAWEDSDAFFNTVMGYASVASSTGIFRSPPLPCPLSSNLFAVGMDIEAVSPRQQPDGTWIFEDTICTTSFRPLPYDIAGEVTGPEGSTPYTYASLRIKRSAEFQTIPQSSMVFESDRTPDNKPFGIVIPTAEYTFRRQYMADISDSQMDALAGKVNAGPFLGRGPGTVLFMGGETQYQWSSDGTRTEEIELVFNWKYVDWNMAWHPRKGVGWDFVCDGTPGTDHRPYKYADLAPLLV